MFRYKVKDVTYLRKVAKEVCFIETLQISFLGNLFSFSI